MKKGSKYVLYSVLAILFCYIYANVDKMHTIYDTSIDTAKYQSVVIEDNNKISQSFYCREKELSGVAVKILVGNTEDTGSVFYSLNDENKKTLVSGELPISDIKNQKINIIKFNNTVSTKEGKLYTISFSKKANEDNTVSIYFIPDEKSNGEVLNVNGEEKEGKMILKTVTHRFDIETFIVTVGFVIYFVVFMAILYKLFS